MLWSATLGAMTIWVALSPLVIGIIYIALAPLLRRLGRRIPLARG